VPLQRPITFSIHEPDGALLRTETVDREIIKIGKLATCHVRVDDEAASRLHAVIEVTAEGAQIIDLGSAAGTIVNGRKVTKAALEPGDKILIGQSLVVVGAGPQRAAAPPAPQPPAPARPACCPRCRLPLVGRSAGGQSSTIGVCQSCGGLWLDRTILRQIADLPGTAAAVRAIADDAARRAPLGGVVGVYNVSCPICSALMERRQHRRTGVVIDLCATHGTWFDRGEPQAVLDTGGTREGPFRSAPRGEEPTDPLPAAVWVAEGRPEPAQRESVLLQIADVLLDLGF
jgi:Zn-finger nucleic acid-binding protein